MTNEDKVEDVLIEIATIIRENHKKESDVSRGEAKKLIDELGIPLHTIHYDLANEDGSYDNHLKYKTINLIKFYHDNYVSSKYCHFLYKRSVQNTMRLVGVIDLSYGTVVLAEDFVGVQAEVPSCVTLCYPEFYIAENRKTVVLSDSYNYSDATYREVEIDRIYNMKEIMVQGEGKNQYVIGFTPIYWGAKEVYLYEMDY